LKQGGSGAKLSLVESDLGSLNILCLIQTIPLAELSFMFFFSHIHGRFLSLQHEVFHICNRIWFCIWYL